MRPDWFYGSAENKECAKAEEFFERNGIRPWVTVDARKVRFGRLEALRLAKMVDGVYAVFNRLVMYLNLKIRRPDVETLTRVLLMPSGNMRSPVVRCGKALVIGFDEETYRDVCGLEFEEKPAVGARGA